MVEVNAFLKTDHNFMEKVHQWNESFENSEMLFPMNTFANGANNHSATENMTFNEEEEREYIFNKLGVRLPFIVVYSTVFCCCVFGNLMVILLVSLSKRLKSTTNFFLANLAVADLCVGIFCVLQNLAFYLITSWIFGDFLCKMNQFIHGLSCTASVFILVVISIERYLAIIHPIRCKQILTKNRLKIIITLVWTISTAYSTPRYLISHTISNHLPGRVETICIMSRMKYNSKIFDIINFILLYLIPLGVMIILYSIIGIRLWNSGLNYSSLKVNHEYVMEKQNKSNSEWDAVTFNLDKRVYTYSDQRRLTYSQADHLTEDGSHCSTKTLPSPFITNYRSSKSILRARRRVIKMLTIIVLTFALCNLPFHARKMWQYWSFNYNGSSAFSALFTPFTFLCTYCNSAINPLLYAFLSKNFQKSLKEIFSCGRNKNSKPSSLKRKSFGNMSAAWSSTGSR